MDRNVDLFLSSIHKQEIGENRYHENALDSELVFVVNGGDASRSCLCPLLSFVVISVLSCTN